MPNQKVSEKYVGKRLDVYLSDLLKKTSRSYVKFLISDNYVTVNKKKGKPSYKVCLGDVVSYSFPEKKDILETKLKVPIIYEDKYCVVLNKPAGVVVHPGDSNKPRKESTLVDVIARDYPGLLNLDKKRPGIVHRLDKDTSGVILVAKTKEALECFKKQFQDRTVKKTYKALVWGSLSDTEGAIEGAIGRNTKNREKFAIMPEGKGKNAHTEYKVEKEYKKEHETLSLVNVYPKTGRTHQIRVHMHSIKHPVVADRLYYDGRGDLGLKRHFLHAESLEIKTPDKKKHTFSADLANDLKKLLSELG